MTNGFQAGQAIVAKNTPLNRNLGFHHKAMDDAGRGFINLVKDDMVSFLFHKKLFGASFSIVASLQQFNENFEVFSTSINSGYVKTHHNTKRYPNEFQPR